MKKMKYIKLAGASYNISRVINNYIKLPIYKLFKRIYVIIGNICYNVKYLCSKNIEIELDIIDNMDDKIYNLQDCIDKLSNDIDDKVNEYDMEDIIDILRDDINDIKDDIETIRLDNILDIDQDIKKHNKRIEEIEKNINNSGGGWIKGDYNVLIEDVIKTIINKLEVNDNELIQDKKHAEFVKSK
jgi:hypothetical protein